MAAQPIQVSVGDAGLVGVMTLPPRAAGMVAFAHGSGSGQRSPPNRAVADVLARAGIGTLLVDPVIGAEELEDMVTGRVPLDIEMLANQVISAIDWLAIESVTGDLPRVVAELPLGCYGAGTGAAAALMAAAKRRERVVAVVSRGGRPDLAGDALPEVTAPTLLIVGERDTEVLRLNRQAQALLGGGSRVEVVQGATHLFEEPGALERVAELARDWFLRHFRAASSH
jgi:putative phosphoribosyl transferase